MSPHTLHGLGASPGVARGPAWLLASAGEVATPRRALGAHEVAGEVQRFRAALDLAEAALQGVAREVGQGLGSASAEIFQAQLLVLRSPSLTGDVERLVHEARINAEAALLEVLAGLLASFERMADRVLGARGADLRDVGLRVLGALGHAAADAPLAPPAGSIVVAEDLLPSVAARLELSRVAAVVTERGTLVGHAAILARSRRTPAVLQVAQATRVIRPGDLLLVDGTAGLVVVDPAPAGGPASKGP